MLMRHHVWSFHTVLDLSGCKGSQILLLNTTIKATDDLDYWEGNPAMVQIYNTTRVLMSAFMGQFYGNGEAHYKHIIEHPSYQRPKALVAIGSSENIIIDGANFDYPRRQRAR